MKYCQRRGEQKAEISFWKKGSKRKGYRPVYISCMKKERIEKTISEGKKIGFEKEIIY